MSAGLFHIVNLRASSRRSMGEGRASRGPSSKFEMRRNSAYQKENSMAVRCVIQRPHGKMLRRWFSVLPRVGEDITLRGDLRHYVVGSVRHLGGRSQKKEPA